MSETRCRYCGLVIEHVLLTGTTKASYWTHVATGITLCQSQATPFSAGVVDLVEKLLAGEISAGEAIVTRFADIQAAAASAQTTPPPVPDRNTKHQQLVHNAAVSEGWAFGGVFPGQIAAGRDAQRWARFGNTIEIEYGPSGRVAMAQRTAGKNKMAVIASVWPSEANKLKRALAMFR